MRKTINSFLPRFRKGTMFYDNNCLVSKCVWLVSCHHEIILTNR